MLPREKYVAPSRVQRQLLAVLLKDAGILECECRDIADILQSEFSNQKISLVKMDIERAELSLLKRCLGRFSHDKSIILCEILDVEDYPKFDELFSNYDYQIIVIDDKNKSAAPVADLSSTTQVGRNVLFMPPDEPLGFLN